MEKRLRILLVDDRDDFREEIALWLKNTLEHEVEEAANLDTALDLYRQAPSRFDLALVDYGLTHNGGAGNGIDLMRALHRVEEHLPVIVITGAGDRDIAKQALGENAFWYLEKPLDLVETEKLLDWVSRYRRTTERIAQFTEQVRDSHAVMAVSHAIASATEIKDILLAVRTKVIEFFGADLCGLLIVDFETGEVTGLPEHPEPEEEALQNEMKATARQLIAGGSPLTIHLEGKSQSFKALIACPCPPQEQKEQGRSSEVLFALFCDHLEDEKVEALHLKLIALARLIGVAIERIRQRQLMEALVKSGQELLRVSTEEQIIKLVAEQITTNFSYSAFYLALYDRSSKTIQLPLYFEQGESARDLVPARVLKDLVTQSPNKSWLGYVLDTNAEFEVEDGESPDLQAQPYPVPGTVIQSYFGVPLRGLDGLAIGVLSLQSASKGTFPQYSKQALRALATLVAPAIERVRHAEKIRRRQEARLHIREQMDRNRLADVINEGLGEVWPGKPVHFELFLADRGNRSLKNASRPGSPPIRYGEGFIGQVAETGKPALFQGMPTEDFPPPFHTRSKSALCVPIKLGDSLLGVLDVESSEEQLFDSEDRLFLEAIAAVIATNLAAAGRKESAGAILTAAARAADAESPEKALEIFSQSAYDITSKKEGGPTSATVFLLAGKILELVSAWPPDLFDDLYKKVGKLPIEPPPGQPRGYVALAALDRKSKFINNVEDSEYLPYDGKTHAELAVPVLAADGTTLGVLNLEYENPSALDVEDIRLIETLADQIGIIAVLQRKAQSFAIQQNILLDEYNIGRFLTEHAIKRTISVLRQNADLGLNYISDLCKKNWGVLQRFVHRALLRRGISGDLNELSGCLTRIDNEAAELEHGGKHVEKIVPLVVKDWINALKDNWQKKADDVRFSLDATGDSRIRVQVDEHEITLAIGNIIANGIRAARKNSRAEPPTISISCIQIQDIVCLEILDNGDGISEETARFLFHSMVPQPWRDAEGHGTGCYLTGRIIRKFKGEVLVLPQKPGARIQVKLPAISSTGGLS